MGKSAEAEGKSCGGEADHLDFTAHAHPVLAVACPICCASPGQRCRRPSGHRAARFHRARGDEADRVFILQHGSKASIECGTKAWWIDKEEARHEGLMRLKQGADHEPELLRHVSNIEDSTLSDPAEASALHCNVAVRSRIGSPRVV